MADDRLPPAGPAEPPGTLTRLIEEVVRGAADQVEREAESSLRPGLLIGRYELLREVGRGGFGVVWEARDRELGRIVAFKALRVRGEAAREKRLLAEAEVAARLSHPNIVTVLDVGRSEHGVHLVQEFLTGAPLTARLAAGRLGLREAVRIGLELARGLAHAHAHGVVHRDLSPGNVQLCDDGQVKILDLGMAAALGRRKLEGGTPAFMAPEQAAGAPEDERTDVYALGVLLYRMLTGASPVSTDPAGKPRSSSRGLEVPECPPLGTLVEAMLAGAPTDRPRDAQVVLEALLEITQELPRSSSGTGRVRIRRPPRARWLTTGVLLGTLLTLAFGVPAWLWLRGSPVKASSEERIVLASSSPSAKCEWKIAFYSDFDTDKVKLAWRNGDFHGQELRRVDGIPVWFQGADWNQLWVPIGDVKPDVFAVEAQFLAPDEPEVVKGASVSVFADPVGPMTWSSSASIHGVSVGIGQEPGQGIHFSVGTPTGQNYGTVDYRGPLNAAFPGRWRKLRVEGSRSTGWMRALVDGQHLLTEFGHRDLSGSHVSLDSGGASYHPSGVMWKHLRVYEGSEACR